jgi:hypothetical protein
VEERPENPGGDEAGGRESGEGDQQGQNRGQQGARKLGRGNGEIRFNQ